MKIMSIGFNSILPRAFLFILLLYFVGCGKHGERLEIRSGLKSIYNHIWGGGKDSVRVKL